MRGLGRLWETQKSRERIGTWEKGYNARKRKVEGISEREGKFERTQRERNAKDARQWLREARKRFRWIGLDRKWVVEVGY